MGRRIYIVSKVTDITDGVKAEAAVNNCPEIVHGLPPRLREKLRGRKLPLVYEEPDQPEPEPMRDPLRELDELWARIENLEAK